MTQEERRVSTPFGEISYVLTVKNVKNMNLRLRPDGTVAVSVGRQTPRAAADAFVLSRAGWIAGHRGRLERRPDPVAAPSRAEAVPVLGASLDRMFPLVEPMGVLKPGLKARYMTSRWGSCHWTQGVIVMNTALAAMPEELLDYVTLHELVHFIHPDHGKGFYAVMDALMPDWREKRRRLKGYTLGKTGT